MAAGNLQSNLQQSKQITLQKTVFCQISVVDLVGAHGAKEASWLTLKEVD